jgi:hypothetical protein
MAKSKKDSLPPKSEREQLLDSIVGPDEEMDDELADEILSSCGITGSDLVREFKLRLQAEIRRHYQETNEVSPSLGAALRSIRESQARPESESDNPQSRINNILHSTAPSNNQGEVSYAFHNLADGEVSEIDKQILDELRIELESDQEDGE